MVLYAKKMKGMKFDNGKPRYDLMESGFANALLEVSKITTFGAEKYAPNNWMLVEEALERYADAQGRHRNARQRGEETDPESGLPHLAHEAWNTLALLELTLRGKM